MAELGVQMFTLRRWTQNLEALRFALAQVYEIGYRTIQASAFGPMAVEDVAQVVSEAGLTVGATHTPWSRLCFELDEVIREHHVLSCEHTAVGMIPKETYLSLDGLDQFLMEVAPIVQRLNEAGISFSYHHHHHEFRHFEGQSWLAHLVERSDAIPLGIEIDTHWVVAGGADPAAWIRRVGHRMPLLHLKDYSLSEADERRFAPLGRGNMNWEEIFEAASEQPIEYYFVEQDRCYGEDPFECLRVSFDFFYQAER